MSRLHSLMITTSKSIHSKLHCLSHLTISSHHHTSPGSRTTGAAHFQSRSKIITPSTCTRQLVNHHSRKCSTGSLVNRFPEPSSRRIRRTFTEAKRGLSALESSPVGFGKLWRKTAERRENLSMTWPIGSLEIQHVLFPFQPSAPEFESLTVLLQDGSLRVNSSPRFAALSLQPMAAEADGAMEHTKPALGFGRHLWRASQREAYNALYNPFVIALASGTLEKDVFKEYIAQDIYFLGAFVEAYGLAIDHTDDQEAKVILQRLQSHVQDELDDVHLAVGGVTSATPEPNPPTTAYTNFLLRVARGASVDDVIVGDGKEVDRSMQESNPTAYTDLEFSQQVQDFAISDPGLESTAQNGEGESLDGKEICEASQQSNTSVYTDLELSTQVLAFALSDPDLETNALNGDGGEMVQRRRIAAYTIVAMTPCNRLYAFLGQEIQRTLKGDTSSNAFSQWIETYASVGFGMTAVESEQLVHRLSLALEGDADRKAMERLYRRAMQLEVDFFAAHRPLTTGKSISVPLFLSEAASSSHFVFVSDFDSTCTVSDSCPALADLSVAAASKEKSAEGRHSSAAQSLRSRWDALVDQYAQEYRQLLDELLSAEEIDQKSKPRPFNPSLLRLLSERLADFEAVSNARVVESGALEGLDVEDVKQAGGTIPLREGCKELLGRVSQMKFPLDFHVLSVCWSRSFIEGSFLAAGLKVGNIQSNELEFDSNGRSTGKIFTRLQTGLDKERAFVDILNVSEGKVDQGKRVCTVYVGDSVTDLLCLLRADIGIVIGESSSLQRVADACGISLVPLYFGVLKQQLQPGQEKPSSWTKVDGVLYRISSFHELNSFLLGS